MSIQNLTTYVIKFKRTETSEPEKGVRIEGSSESLIVDIKGNVVTEVWSYSDHPYLGCLSVSGESNG